MGTYFYWYPHPAILFGHTLTLTRYLVVESEEKEYSNLYGIILQHYLHRLEQVMQNNKSHTEMYLLTYHQVTNCDEA